MTDAKDHEDQGSRDDTGIEALDAVFQPVNRSDCPGLAVAVALDGETIYRKAFGLASVQHGVVNTPATRMRIGSTSKHFTCLAALLLVEDGKLDIDAPATEYLPELPDREPVPTLRQFMHHTSGYRCSLDVAMTANGDARQPDGWTLKTLARQAGRNFEPGQGQMYCNGGYHLLSIVIDRVAEMSMEDFLKERVFLPLGMLDTEGVPSDESVLPGVASLHLPTPDGGYRRGGFFQTDIRGEGNLVSTVDDMLIWLAHMNGPKRVGSESTWSQMFEPAILDNGLRSVYSFGLQNHQYRGVDVIHHAGSVIGGNSQMLTVPQHGIDIVILANGMNANAQELAWQIVDTILGEKLAEPKPEIAPLESYTHLVGRKYHATSGVLVGFGELGDRLGTSFMGTPYMPILRETPNGLTAGFEHIALGPLVFDNLEPDADGNPPEFISYSESGNTDTLRLLPEEPIPSAASGPSLTGNYFSADAGADISIKLEDEDLILTIRGDYSGTRKFRIEIYSDESVGIRNLDDPTAGCAMVVRNRDDSGRVLSFEIDTVRSRHLRFDRTGDVA
ncbi:MAG: serine hydrolase domain-containing protein [Xanthomonadales bacterium]|nr:serine hydrolase domain-containing protein [Xanthomonadales bacterium]